MVVGIKRTVFISVSALRYPLPMQTGNRFRATPAQEQILLQWIADTSGSSEEALPGSGMFPPRFSGTEPLRLRGSQGQKHGEEAGTQKRRGPTACHKRGDGKSRAKLGHSLFHFNAGRVFCCPSLDRETAVPLPGVLSAFQKMAVEPAALFQRLIQKSCPACALDTADT